jgi:very-short-patch-repair endonuclease
VFALSEIAASTEQDLLVAAWTCGGPVSHLSAAWLAGLVDDPVKPVHVSVAATASHRFADTVVHRCDDLDTIDRTRRRRIPTTTTERTLIDLAAVLEEEDLRTAVDRALRRGLTTPDRLSRRVRALARPGRAGAASARRVLAEIDEERAMSESELESALFALVVESGLPAPTPQHEVVIEGRRYRIDLCYPHLRLAIEVDGFGVHGSRAAFEADRARQNDLVLAGWRVLRFTWRQLRDDPAGVVAQLRAAIDAAA